MNFDSFNFDPRVAAGIQALGYTEPTPIQAQAIPAILEGHDVMGLAQTGTGKTAAFVLPILQRLLNGPRRHVRALIVTPTRELAEQIHDAIGELGRQTRLRSVTVYGGVSMYSQTQKLNGGVEIVVACPGRLLDHLKQGQINLSQLEVLVLDEADRMFDMGFLPEVRKIIKHVPAKR
ncbi:MAG TPA: DEAD/DEAH box helicase, partial [Anaerolineales bacterium]|nr:DEAD/DEAH box helicase [Anaerolineales bacterium]